VISLAGTVDRVLKDSRRKITEIFAKLSLRLGFSVSEGEFFVIISALRIIRSQRPW
jgi:hypothetical protein